MADSSMLHVNKELKIAVWPSAQSINLPIQAFFLDGGLKAAQYDQLAFKKVAGRFMPIVKLILPLSSQGKVRFLYTRKDQR